VILIDALGISEIDREAAGAELSVLPGRSNEALARTLGSGCFDVDA
jgi:hypothetical protein